MRGQFPDRLEELGSCSEVECFQVQLRETVTNTPLHHDSGRMGPLEAKGERRGRVYHLSGGMHRQLGHPAAHVGAHGISAMRQEATVLEDAAAHGRIQSAQVIGLFGFDRGQAQRLLRRRVKA